MPFGGGGGGRVLVIDLEYYIKSSLSLFIVCYTPELYSDNEGPSSRPWGSLNCAGKFLAKTRVPRAFAVPQTKNNS